MSIITADEITTDEAMSGAAANDEWRDQANCKGHLSLFFAKKAERPQARARREAKANALCKECPVVEPCREFARQNREYGFWAGESEEDRHLLGFTVSAPIGLRARKYRTGENDTDAA
ncbi:MAG: WhiB family transcriptional regulator [Actinomycetota bacterium]